MNNVRHLNKEEQLSTYIHHRRGYTVVSKYAYRNLISLHQSYIFCNIFCRKNPIKINAWFWDEFYEYRIFGRGNKINKRTGSIKFTYSTVQYMPYSYTLYMSTVLWFKLKYIIYCFVLYRLTWTIQVSNGNKINIVFFLRMNIGVYQLLCEDIFFNHLYQVLSPRLSLWTIWCYCTQKDFI